ncbi:MAG: ABC transporter ATP-binding protein [Lachnospiraceae bacterium]|nr:ABC transporter ATP-binding protein [Lachnospiraceae bacterium]
MEIKKLCFSYGENRFIENLSGNIAKGKITTILGPNGCGKSTLLNLLVNQLKPQGGKVTLDGKEIRNIPLKDMAKTVAMVHQQNSAPPDTTVERLIHFGRMPYQSMFSTKDEDGEQIVTWALKVTNLTHMAKKRVSQLSGGERQRAWIALALAQKTDILFLDEPTTYLDIYYQMEILSLVRKLNREYNMTIVMVLHDINQAMQFSDNLIIMKKGNICYAGPVAGGITEERLKEVYGIKAVIRWSKQNNCPYMIPLVEHEEYEVAAAI